MDEIKILLKPELEYYHSLLLTHGESLIDNFKNTLPKVVYNETSRIIEFGSQSYFDTSIKFTHDEQGNVALILPVTMSMTNDGVGNVVVTGATFIDDGKGNVYIN